MADIRPASIVVDVQHVGHYGQSERRAIRPPDRAIAICAESLPDALAISAKGVVLLAVPMFHVNARGAALRGNHGRRHACFSRFARDGRLANAVLHPGELNRRARRGV
jgi:hypothetical protein